MRGDLVSIVGHSKNTDSYFEAKGEPLQCFEREVLWSHQHFSSVTLMAVLRIDCKGRSRDRLGGCCKSPDKRWWWEMVRFWLCVEGRAKGMCWWGGEEMRRWGKKSKRWHPGFWSELGLELSAPTSTLLLLRSSAVYSLFTDIFHSSQFRTIPVFPVT